MTSSTSTSPVQRFGGFEIDPRSRELCREGIRIRMQPQPLEVLLLLLVRKGEVVTREELKDRLWPAGTFVDADDGLNTAIRKLREVLGDSAECPVYIETIPRLGYRFIGPVEEGCSRPIDARPPSTESSSVTAANPGETVPAAGVPGSWAGTFPLLLVAAVGFASAVWYMRRPLPPARISDYIQITHDGGAKYLAGTDGSRLYFNWNNGTQPIAQVAVAGGKIAPFPLPLPRPTLGDVSPDGSSFLVRSEENGQLSLWDVQVPGESVRRLANGVASAAWSPDGKSIIYSTSDDEIYVARSDGTNVRKLVSPEHPNASWVAAHDLIWSPSGSNIRFTRDNRIWEVSSDGSGIHQLLPGWHPSSRLCCGRWTPDGKFFLFMVLGNLPYAGQLWVLDERRILLRQIASEPVQLASGPIRWSTPIPSRDGMKIFARGVIFRGEMVRYDAPSQELKPWLEGISAEHLTYSSDGKSIAYVSFPEGILWRGNWDGANPVQLTSPPFYPINPRWSPDGSKILFYDDQSVGIPQFYIVSSHGGIPQPILLGNSENPWDPDWSPDGNKIVFGSGGWTRYSSEGVIRVLDLASYRIATLPGSLGIFSPRWSPNGRFIAGINSTGGISVFDTETQRWSKLHEAECNSPTWSKNSQFVYFLLGDRSSFDELGVYRVRVSGGRAERVVNLKGFHHTGVLGAWMGLDPTDTPMLFRDRGSDDIYALTLEEK